MLKQLLTEFGYCILEMFRTFFTEFNNSGNVEAMFRNKTKRNS